MIIAKDNKYYPKSFKKLASRPEYIYAKGDRSCLNNSKVIGIVGSRKMTSYGERVLDIFIPQLIQAGYVIASGFMYGVDTYAHTLSVDSGGKTIAVLGSGIDAIYPQENKELYTKITKDSGCVISEYEPDQKPKPWMFAKRNRLIAALAESLIVIEAGLNSGSLITAQRAIELGKPVYAVPGQITSSVSKGTNALIASGKATILHDISMITNRLTSQESLASPDLKNALQENIYSLLQTSDMSIDQLSVKLDKNAQEISTCLMEMDFSGIITEDRGVFRILEKRKL